VRVGGGDLADVLRRAYLALADRTRV
jgi:hypothetical protein